MVGTDPKPILARCADHVHEPVAFGNEGERCLRISIARAFAGLRAGECPRRRLAGDRDERDGRSSQRPTLEEHLRFLDEVQQEWGGPSQVDTWAPSVADDDRFKRWWGQYLRLGASPAAWLRPAIALSGWVSPPFTQKLHAGSGTLAAHERPLR